MTAWTSPEAAESALARSAAHEAARERVWRDGFGARGFTSFWAPYRLNQQFVLCSECARHVAFEAGRSTVTCECGAEQTVSPYL